MMMMLGDLKSYPTVQIVFDVFEITFLQEINFTQTKKKSTGMNWPTFLVFAFFFVYACSLHHQHHH
jgi:hypothetical protein